MVLLRAALRCNESPWIPGMSDLVKFLSKILLACLLVIVVGWSTYIGVRYYHAEQVAYRWISGLAEKQAVWEKKIDAAGGNTLTGYAAPDAPMVVEGLEGNFSGLTYDPLQKRLWAVGRSAMASEEGAALTRAVQQMSEVLATPGRDPAAVVAALGRVERARIAVGN